MASLPGLRSLLRRITGKPAPSARPGRPSWLLARSFGEASAMADGYAVPEILDAKIVQAREQRQSFRSLAASRTIPAEKVFFQHFFALDKVRTSGARFMYEVGGAAGNWAFILNSYLTRPFESWTIREQKPLVDLCKKTGWEQESGLLFVSERVAPAPAAAAETVYFSQGALQFMDDPAEELSWIFSAGFAWVYFSRTPLCTNRTERLFPVQRHYLYEHAPGFIAEEEKNRIIAIPNILLPEKEFFSRIPDSYEIIFQTVEEGIRLLPIEGVQIEIKELGILLRKKSA